MRGKKKGSVVAVGGNKIYREVLYCRAVNFKGLLLVEILR